MALLMSSLKCLHTQTILTSLPPYGCVLHNVSTFHFKPRGFPSVSSPVILSEDEIFILTGVLGHRFTSLLPLNALLKAKLIISSSLLQLTPSYQAFSRITD